MNYNYEELKQKIIEYLKNHPEEYFYSRDIAKALNLSVYSVDKALKTINSNQIMYYKSSRLQYVHKDEQEKQVPAEFVSKFIQNGWLLGRCEASKRAICIAEGGDPDRNKTIWIHRGYENKQIFEKDKDHWTTQGWVSGKLNLSTLNKVAIHKNNIERYVLKEEVEQYTTEGWIVGGKPKASLRDYSHVWNKGKTKETDERLKILSDKIRVINKNISQETRNKISKCVSNLWKDEEYRKNQLSQMKGRVPWNKGKRYHLSKDSYASWMEKSVETKRKRNSFNTSLPEEQYYTQLLTQFSKDDIIRQYYDKSRYPFHCDFYIKSIDKFIECNFHWTHNNHPFNETINEDIEEAKLLQTLAQNSKYYQVAYDVWTKLDVRKREIAIKNNLHYEAIYGGSYGSWKNRCN